METLDKELVCGEAQALGYQVMVAIKLGVDAYRSSSTLRFDPVKEEVVKA